MINAPKKIEICEKVALLQNKWLSSTIKSEYSLVDFKDVQTSTEYLENVPTSNIKIEIRKWSVIDNRGFVIKLSRNNIMFLLNNCLIRHSRIMEPCVYNRIRRNTYSLIPLRFV